MSNAVIIAESEMISKIKDLAREYEIRASEPTPIDSISNSLNWELSPGEIRPICEALTLMFSTGIVGIAFMSKLRSFIRGQQVEIRDPKTGQKRGTLSEETSDEEIKQLVDS